MFKTLHWRWFQHGKHGRSVEISWWRWFRPRPKINQLFGRNRLLSYIYSSYSNNILTLKYSNRSYLFLYKTKWPIFHSHWISVILLCINYLMLNKQLLIVHYLHLELIFLLLLMVQLLDIPLSSLNFQLLLQIQESLKLQIHQELRFLDQ